MAETLRNRSCSSAADASWNLAWKLRLPNLIFVLLLLWLTEVFNFEGLYLAEVFPAMMLAIFLIGLMFLLRSLSPSFLWHIAADSSSARRGILLRLVVHEGERLTQKVGRTTVSTCELDTWEAGNTGRSCAGGFDDWCGSEETWD